MGFIVVPLGAVPAGPGAAAPLGGELGEVAHAGALPDGWLVADAHAEELHGAARRARARVVPVVPALRAPPRPVPGRPARRRRRRRRRRHAVPRHG